MTIPYAEERHRVLRQALSVSIATGLYGISFGALSIAAGLTPWQTMALSVLMFSGGSQFAFIGVVGAGGSSASAIATAGLLGVRNGLYGVQLGPLLALKGWRRVAAAQFTIDESTAVATAQTTTALRRVGFWSAGLGVFACWNGCTFIGILAGNAIGDPKIWGLDAAAAAAFLGLLWPRLARRAAQACAGLAVVIACVLIPFTPAGIPVLASGAAAIVVGILDSRRTPTTDAAPRPTPDHDAHTHPGHATHTHPGHAARSRSIHAAQGESGFCDYAQNDEKQHAQNDEKQYPQNDGTDVHKPGVGDE